MPSRPLASWPTSRLLWARQPTANAGSGCTTQRGSLMNWLVMKLVFASIPKQPMPFFVRPVAKALCATVQSKLIDPNVDTALDFMEDHLATHHWFAGEHITMADFQMSFAVEAALARANPGKPRPHLQAYLQRMQARPAYQRGIAKGGPVVMSA